MKLSFDKIPQLSALDRAYSLTPEAFAGFIEATPTAENLARQIIKKDFSQANRDLLATELAQQYAGAGINDALVLSQIALLRSPDTFTITTAHQPALFTGPLFFIYKVLSAIKMAEDLNAKYATYRFVPVYWNGGEDHDFEEVNHLNAFGKNVTWQHEKGGPVSKFGLEGIETAMEDLNTLLGNLPHAAEVVELLQKSKEGSSNYADFQLKMMHALFGRFGLVCINPMSSALKEQLIEVVKAELLTQVTASLVAPKAQAIEQLGYKPQAVGRDINLFYLGKDLNIRERIVKEGNNFKVLNTELSFSEAEIMQEVNAAPERFSPNVLLRPLYQEILLPNIAFVGGGGEIAYWLLQKGIFEHFKVTYPILVRRDSVLWLDTNSHSKIQKLGFSVEQFFQSEDFLTKSFLEKNSSTQISLTEEKNTLAQLFESIKMKAIAADPTLAGTVEAELVKAIKSVEQLEGRLLKAEKQKHEVSLQQIKTLKAKLFPSNGLQERSENGLPLLAKYGMGWLDKVKDALQPLDSTFKILEEG